MMAKSAIYEGLCDIFLPEKKGWQPSTIEYFNDRKNIPNPQKMMKGQVAV